MKDKLEKFIAETRDQFDVYDPDDTLWKGITSRIRKRRRLRISTTGILWRAAAVIIIFAISFIVQEYLHRNNIVISRKGQNQLAYEIPELKEVEIYYTNLFNEKINEIQPLLIEYPDLGLELKNDLAELDSIYAELQKDLADNIANDEVIEAMIQNYRLKLQILEDLLVYLQESTKAIDDEKDEFDT